MQSDTLTELVQQSSAALEAATQYMINHPDEAWDFFKGSNPAELDNELNRRAWRDTLPRFALRPAALDRARYDRFAEFLQQQGLVDKTPDLDSYAIELR